MRDFSREWCKLNQRHTKNTAVTYNPAMLTIIETPTFQKLVTAIWSEDELEAFKVWLAQQPVAGEVIPGAGGLRKVRWSRAGMGKRGGARVVYLTQLMDGTLALLMIYSKSKFDNLPKEFLLQLKKEFEHGR